MGLLEPNKWVERYADYMLSQAVFRVNHREDAEDLVQETFAAAWKSKETFQGHSSEKTWLIAILQHKIIDYYRRKKKIETIEEWEEDSLAFDQHFFDEKNYGHWKATTTSYYIQQQADASMLSHEFKKAINTCLDKIPPRLKQVFIAKYFDEKETTLVLKEHQISDANFWVIIFRAKIIFRACLERNEIIERGI